MTQTEKAAKLCHELISQIRLTFGESELPKWEDAPQQDRDSTFDSLMFFVNNPDKGPDGLHIRWSAAKKAAGWVHGPVKDPELKTHPLIDTLFSTLKPHDQLKDAVFEVIAKSFRVAILAEKSEF